MKASTRARCRTRDDDGLSLVEVIVAITVVGIVMAAAGLFFINALKSTSGQGQRNQAINVAQRYMESTSATKPAELLKGRYKATVDTFLTGTRASTLTANDVTSCPIPAGTCPVYYDTTATSSSTPVVPLTQTSTVSGTSYTVRTFIDGCYLNTAGSCLSTTSTGAQTLYRVTVDVAWTRKNGGGCSGGCAYSMASLVDLHGDPVFNTNISTVDITSVLPTGGVATGATKTMTINGTGFRSGATVTITASTGGTFGAIATNTGNVITVPFTAGSTATNYNVSVVNPDGGRDSYPFTVNPSPVITTLSPALVGNTPTTVTLTGTGFQTGLTIAATAGTVSGATYVSPTSATFSYTGPQVGGPVTFTLTNTDGGVDTQAATVKSAPSITSFSPSTSTVNQAKSVTILGGGFVSGATVAISSGGTATVTSVASDGSSLVANITGTSVNANATITITNPDGGTTARNGFTVMPLPSISTISQANYAASTVASGVVISGAGFQAGATVTMTNGFTAAVTAVAADGSSVTVSVTPNGSASSGGTFTVRNPDGNQTTSGAVLNNYLIPTTTNASPLTVAKNATIVVTVTGTSFVTGQTTLLVTNNSGGTTYYSGPLNVTSSTSGTFTMPATASTGSATRKFTVTVGGVAVSSALSKTWQVT